MIVRACQRSEYAALRSVMLRAFKTPDEANLWDVIVDGHPSMQPQHIRVALDGERPVACTMVVPRQIRTRQGWVPGAIITLVACDPDIQGKGYGGATVRDALAYMAEQGMAVGVLHGHPTYYPRFGFAPVLPQYRVTLPVKGDVPASELRAVTPADLPALAALYAATYDHHACAVTRSADAFLWQLRHPDAQELLALPGLDGYALISVNNSGDALPVHEAAASSTDAYRQLLASLARRAAQLGKTKLTLALPPDHLLARLALTLPGAEAHHYPASYAMAAITRWEPLLPPDYTCDGNTLSLDRRAVLEADRLALTQLVLGYRSIDDLLLAHPAARVAGAAALAQLQRDFPPLTPDWTLDPFWY